MRFATKNIAARYTLIAILLLTFFSFYPSLYNGFVNWDDPDYLLYNPTIQSLKFDNIQKIFTSFVVGNYQPLSVVTFALEYKVVGYHPLLYHFDNLALHIINTALVFLLALQITRHASTALITALLFGIHPTRVESVAWVTERKDVLFTFFYLLAILFYILKHTHKRAIPFATMTLFLLSCLAKPAAVSLPLVILLLDYFYTGRLRRTDIISKIPYFLIALVFGIIAIAATYSPFDNPFPDGPSYDWWERLIFCGAAVSGYLLKLFWPISLSAFYPYPSTQELPAYFIATILLAGIGTFLFHYRHRQRLAFFGVLFFLSTILLNLPILSVGHTLMADRFTYLPYVGLFILIAEGIRTHFLLPHGKFHNALWTIILIIAISSLALLTADRCRIWKNGKTLWSDVIKQFPNVALAYQNRADWYAENQNIAAALTDYTEAIRSDARFFAAFNNRGNMNLLLNQTGQALQDYNRAIELKPDYLAAYLNRGQCLFLRGDFARADQDFDTALRLSPNHPIAVDGKKNVIEKLKQTQ